MKLMISAEDKKTLRDFHYSLEFSGKVVLAFGSIGQFGCASKSCLFFQRQEKLLLA